MPTTEQDVQDAADRVTEKVLASVRNEEDIQKAIEAGEGHADLKEKQEKISGETVEALDNLKDRVDELEMAKNRPSGDGAQVEADHVSVDMAKGLVEKLRKSDMNSGTYDRRVEFSMDEAKGEVEPESAGYKSRRVKGTRRKDVTVVDDTVFEPTYRDGIITPNERGLVVRDLIPVINTNSPVAFWIEEQWGNNGAAVQDGVGATKGKSDVDLVPKNESMKTIAHTLDVPKQYLDDFSTLEQHLRNRMGYKLDVAEDDALLYGNGQGNNIHGLFPQATPFDESLLDQVAAPSSIDRMRMAMAQVANAEYAPSGFVLDVVNWALVELQKDGQNAYVFATPQNSSEPRMWGLPVSSTSAVQGDDFMCGAFDVAAEIHQKQAATVEASSENKDNFDRNMVSIRAEKRAVLALLRPKSFVEGQLNGPAA